MGSSRRTLITSAGITCVVYFGGCSAQAQDVISGLGRSAVEDIYVVRSFRESRDLPTAFCAEQRTGFGGTTREDRFTFRSITTSSATGLVTNANVATVGRLHTCVGPGIGASSFNFYAEGVLGQISFSGRGECVTEPDYPEAGLTFQRCFLQLGELPDPYVGGQLTTNTINSRAPLGGVSDPPGYTQQSVATVRLWKRRQ